MAAVVVDTKVIAYRLLGVEDALILAAESDHSPYDTLFIAAAEREGTKLLTYDRRLQKAFPATAVDPAAFRDGR